MYRSPKMVIVAQETLAHLQAAATPAAAATPVPATPAARDTSGSDGSVGNDDSTQTPGDIFSRLYTEMYKILKSKNFDDIREKCKNYLQVLRRYLFFKDRERFEQALAAAPDTSSGVATTSANVDRDEHDDVDAEETDTEAVSPSSSRRQRRSQRLNEDDILESVPKVDARKANLLLHHWRNETPERIDWDGNGTIILDGKLLKDRSIARLLNELLTKRRGRRRVGVANDDDDDTSIARRLLQNFVATSKTPRALINNSKYRLSDTSGITTRSKFQAPTTIATPFTRKKRSRDKSYEVFDLPDNDPQQLGQPKKRKRATTPSSTRVT